MKSYNILSWIILLYGIGVITINSLNLHYSDNSDSEKCNICYINNKQFGKIGISMGVLFMFFSLFLISAINDHSYQIEYGDCLIVIILIIVPISFICLNVLAIFQLMISGGYDSNCDRYFSLKFDNCNQFKINLVGINIFINGFGIILIGFLLILFIGIMVVIGIIMIISTIIHMNNMNNINKNKKNITIYYQNTNTTRNVDDLQVVNINNNMESDNISLPPPYSDNISLPPPYSMIKIIETEI
jgi:hypothetical protein